MDAKVSISSLEYKFSIEIFVGSWDTSCISLLLKSLVYLESSYTNSILLTRLQQIHKDLSSPDERAFFPKNAKSGLHVHVAINGGSDVDLESPVGFACMQNVTALYGLFEDEIEKWLPVNRRDAMFTLRIRLGMEKQRLQDFEPTARPHELLTFTPQQFTQFIYQAKDANDLRKVTTGTHDGSYVTVNISPERDNKPTTIEFRHHQGLTDPAAIKWWVTFVVHLVKYSYLLAQLKYQIRDEVDFTSQGSDGGTRSLVEDYASQVSILDVLGFPAGGKAHFAARAEMHRDKVHDAEREMDKWFVWQRCMETRRTGMLTGGEFDKALRVNPDTGYKEAVARIQEMYMCTLP